MMSKKLVAYFSASGVTARAAKKIAAEQQADLFEIKPAVPYTSYDLDWTDRKSRSTIEMNDKTARPEMTGDVDNMDGYDEIWLGYPIWWGLAPRIINTFLERYDLTGKTIVPFATSGGSGFGKSGEELKRVSAPAANWKKGEMYR